VTQKCRKSWGRTAPDHVGVIDQFVEAVQLPGIVERVDDERDQAQDIEMTGLVGAATAEIDEQADGQIG